MLTKAIDFYGTNKGNRKQIDGRHCVCVYQPCCSQSVWIMQAIIIIIKETCLVLAGGWLSYG